ncbi:MAG: MBL fold metallo-hydrolase [Candidatus Paceibacterota bacterium]|jgi:metallo-beta-lactamase family protein
MKLTFYGGAGTVTGSNYLLESGTTKILIDCGLFQGTSFCELSNFKPFAYDPKSVTAVFVTHAHIDHIGRLPQLHKSGFRGRVISSEPSRDFAEALLIDTEHIMREEAAKRKKEPIYELNDIAEVMKLWEGIPYHHKIEIGPFVIELYDAGHVLGSASVVVSAEGKRIVFSGDLGNVPSPFIRPTEYISDVDYALIESTYGDRIHENLDSRKEILEDLIEETVKSRGVVMIPAFALERTQEMLFELNELVEHGRIPKVPIFIDSPLAIKLTAVYEKYSRNPMYFSKEAIALTKKGDSIFNFPGLRMTLSVEQSKEINEVPSPKVIIAGSGMSQGGRIMHHEQRYLSDPKSTILFVGYQAVGSLGRQILDGAKIVRVLGEDVAVHCKVKAIGGYSAHADQPQLLRWVEPMKEYVKKVFVVQGEVESANVLAEKIRDTLAVKTEIPTVGSSVVL